MADREFKMPDFKDLLLKLHQSEDQINLAIPELGIVNGKISDIREDIVCFQPSPPHSRNIIYLHYSSVIVVT